MVAPEIVIPPVDMTLPERQRILAKIMEKEPKFYWVKLKELTTNKLREGAMCLNTMGAFLHKNNFGPNDNLNLYQTYSPFAFICKTNGDYRLIPIHQIAGFEYRELAQEEELIMLGTSFSELKKCVLNANNMLYWKDNYWYQNVGFAKVPQNSGYHKISFKNFDLLLCPTAQNTMPLNDCGSAEMHGFGDSIAYVRNTITNGICLSAFFYVMEYYLGMRGWIVCSCREDNSPVTSPGYSVRKVLSLIAKYSGAHIPSNNRAHSAYPLNTPGSKGLFQFYKTGSNFANILTLDGLRQFYEGPEFQNDILPTLYDFNTYNPK